jgi:hypothetical protein
MKRVLFSFLITLAVSAAASAQGTFTFYFPQLALGAGWRTTIFLSSVGATGPANGTLTFTANDGSPLNSNWFDENGANVTAGSNAVQFGFDSGVSRKFTSDTAGPLTVGYATVVCTSCDNTTTAILGTAMFTLTDGGGNILAEAGVPMAIPLGKQAVFVDTTTGFRTGVAIANPNAGSLEVHFELVSDNGQLITSGVKTLSPFAHIAMFTDELFPGQPPMVGRLQYWCMNPMVSVGLRFSPSVQFTTIPPLAVAN